MAVEPKSTGRVCVACKLPHGLLIQHYKPASNAPITASTPNIAPQVDGEPVLLAGGNSRGAIGGFGFTENVDAAWFTAWLAANKGFAPVRANLLFAEDTIERARARAREQAKVRSGFEALDPEHPPGGVMPGNYEGRPEGPAG